MKKDVDIPSLVLVVFIVFLFIIMLTNVLNDGTMVKQEEIEKALKEANKTMEIINQE